MLLILLPFFPQATVTFLYMFFFEIRLKRNKKVRWDDVTIVEEGSNDDVIFTESNSPSESVMGRSVHVSRHVSVVQR